MVKTLASAMPVEGGEKRIRCPGKAERMGGPALLGKSRGRAMAVVYAVGVANKRSVSLRVGNKSEVTEVRMAPPFLGIHKSVTAVQRQKSQQASTCHPFCGSY